jgi:hypothetical protein
MLLPNVKEPQSWVVVQVGLRCTTQPEQVNTCAFGAAHRGEPRAHRFDVIKNSGGYASTEAQPHKNLLLGR